MRLPESRFKNETHSRRTSFRGGRIVAVVAIAVAAAILAGGFFLVIRLRSPIIPFAETKNIEDALSLWNEQEYDKVIEVTSEQLQEYPMDDTALSLRGFAQFYLAVQMVETERKQLLLTGSVRDLRRALLLQEPILEAEVYYVLGKAYFTMGSYFYDEAIDALTKAKELGLDQLDMLEYMAIASEDLGRDDDAIAYYEAAIDRDNEAIHKISLADLLIKLGRFSYADRLLVEAIASNPDNTLLQQAYMSRGKLFREQRKFQESIAAYEALLAINSSSAEAHFGLGETWLAAGENERARFEWREAIRLDPNHIESLQRLREY